MKHTITQQAQAIITTHALTKRYKDTLALDTLNLSVAKGEIFGFLGHNGAGKTTTVSILTTLIAPTSGNATVCGFDTQKESIEVQKRIGYLPENVKFYDSLTAYENLEYLAKLSGVKNPKEKIHEVLVFLEFTGIERKKLGEFSKGMRQRIGIAQAILHDPEVLFLDEPTSGLDPMGIKKLRDIIIRLNKEKGMTIFMNTHLLSEVAKTCTTIGVLNRGKLIYCDSLAHTMERFHDESSLEEIYFTLDEQH
ncbi:MAG: ABC transporter ATP-binding protein [Minisyncoccota bacterium]